MLDSLVTNIEEIIAEFGLQIDLARCNIRASQFDTGDTDDYYEGQLNAYCSMVYCLEQLVQTVQKYSSELDEAIYQLESQLDEAIDRLERESEK